MKKNSINGLVLTRTQLRKVNGGGVAHLDGICHGSTLPSCLAYCNENYSNDLQSALQCSLNCQQSCKEDCWQCNQCPPC